MLTRGQKVFSTEHPKAIGTVVRVTESGAAIEFETPASDSLPFGHIIVEWFPTDDQCGLMPLEKIQDFQN